MKLKNILILIFSFIFAYGITKTVLAASDRSPLIEAVRSGNIELVQKLLQEGADPDQIDEDNTPVLTLASSNLAVVKALLQAGADPDKVDDVDASPLWWGSKRR